MKKALRDKLIAKYPGVFKKLTPKGQEILVDKLATKLTSEDEIEDFVNGLENTIEIFVDVTVSESDRRVKEAVDKVKTSKKDDDEDDKDKDKQDTPGDVASIVAAEIAKALGPLQAQLNAEKSKNVQSAFIEKAKAKGISETYAKRFPIGEDFNEETALTELETEWTEINQTKANSSTGGFSTAAGTTGGKGVSAAIKNFTKQQVESIKKD